MTLSLKINGTERISYIEERSMTLRTTQEEQGVFDFTLVNPPTVPSVQNIVQLSGTILMYSGTVSSVTTREYDKGSTLWVDVSCQNAATNPGGLPTDAPFDLSDNPDNVTTFGYRGLSVQTHVLDSGTQTTGRVTLYREGLAPGQNIEITSANHGLSAEEFTIREISVRWPEKDTPEFDIAFGSPLVRLYQIVTEIPDGSITTTKISDGAITTPKLAANAVIANVINAGGTVTIDSTGITLTDEAGQSVLTSAGFGGSWLDFVGSTVYNGTFRAGAGVAASKPAREEVTQDSDLPFWTVELDGVTSASAKVYHASSEQADYLHEARLWANTIPSGSYVQVRQRVPVPMSVTRHGAHTLGGLSVRVPYEVIDAHADYQVHTEIQQYGYDATSSSFISLDSAVVGAGGIGAVDGVTGMMQPTIYNLNPLTTELDVAIRLIRTVVNTSGTCEVALRNVLLFPSSQAVLWNAINSGSYAAYSRTGVYLDGTSKQQLYINPDPSTSTPTDKRVKLDSNLDVEGDVDISGATDFSTGIRIITGSAPTAGGFGLEVNENGASIWGASSAVHGSLIVDNSIKAGETGANPPILLSQNGYIEIQGERTTPAAPDPNFARIYLDDNGAGKTRLRVRFNTGAVQTIATEP